VIARQVTWAEFWNHDVQFGFVCGVFVGVIGLAVMFFALDLLAWLIAGRRKPQPPPAERIRRYESQGGPNGQSWRKF
jgi:hypothetical protein